MTYFKTFRCSHLDVNCGGVTPIQDGDVTLVDGRTTHGARAMYSCKENYTLVGEQERVCGDEGIWDGEAPKCLFDWCPEPPPVAGATVDIGGHKAGSLATYTCQNGFILFGSPVSTSRTLKLMFTCCFIIQSFLL